MGLGPITVDREPDLTKEQQEIARVLFDPGQWAHRLCWDDSGGHGTYGILPRRQKSQLRSQLGW